MKRSTTTLTSAMKNLFVPLLLKQVVRKKTSVSFQHFLLCTVIWTMIYFWLEGIMYLERLEREKAVKVVRNGYSAEKDWTGTSCIMAGFQGLKGNWVSYLGTRLMYDPKLERRKVRLVDYNKNWLPSRRMELKDPCPVFLLCFTSFFTT